MVYGEDEVVTLVLVPFPISFQITTKVNISDLKHPSAVFHVKVIVEPVVAVVTTGGPGWAGGGKQGKAGKYFDNIHLHTPHGTTY